MWEDLEPFCPHIRGGAWHLMAVNDVGMHIPLDLRHWFSNGAEDVANWSRCRRTGYNRNATRHALKFAQCKAGANYYWPWPGHGTSSLNAVLTGIALEYDEIILCGIPLDNTGHYFDPPWVRSNFEREVPYKDGELKWWAKAADRYFDGRVKSRSGRTRELLGAP